MAFIEQDRRSRLPSVAAVVLIHAGIGYAFLSGLAYTVLDKGPDIFRLIEVRDTPPPPPPEPRAVERTESRPVARTVAVPETIVPTPADPVVIDVQPMTMQPAEPYPGPKVALPPAEPVLSKVPQAAPRAIGNRARWIETGDYPPAALRQGEEGSVGIAVRIGRDGRVQACDVTASSGSRVLDAATCRLYAARARFAPATENGAAVAATLRDRITWRLPR